MPDIYTKIESIATAVSAVITLIGLVYAGIQLRDSKRIARGEFLLHLDEILQEHMEVHKNLRPGGVWSDGKSGPGSSEEWIAVERYMGIFERVQILIENKIIDLDTIYRLYGYRVFNIVANPVIHQAKLIDNAASWGDFIKLWHALEEKRKKRV